MTENDAHASGPQLVGRIVKIEAGRRGLSQPQLAELSGLGIATIARIVNGKPNIAAASLARLEGVFDMPRELLIAVRDGNGEAVRRMEVSDGDLVRYVLDLMGQSGRDGEKSSSDVERTRHAG